MLSSQAASTTRYSLSLLSFLAAAAVHAAPASHLIKRDPLPSYVLQYAPYIRLHSEEQYWPTDVTTFLANTVPRVDFQASSAVANFADLDTFPETSFLTSIEPVPSNPAWLNSDAGKPDANGNSTAPATIIVAPKDGGIVDAFYFFLYAFNEGQEVLGQTFGSHVADWEHVMIRFIDEQPQSVYMSQHDEGEAVDYASMLKTENRPTVYVAKGGHGNYPLPGGHSYDDVLQDETDAGLAWDVTLNYRAFLFDSTSEQFTLADAVGTAAGSEATEGSDWLLYKGAWGDQKYPDSQDGQFCIFGHCRYENGVYGPYLKNLGRTDVCQADSGCTIQTSLF